jgi:UDP-N-acetylmuramoyl-L-alanyl-D-glutamate--2,6-diaminopimelate ligase
MSMPAEHMTTTITLAELLRGFADAPTIRIQGISSDSRQLKPGDLFLACAGHSSHGLDYVGDAVSGGVAAIAWDSSTADSPAADVGVPMVAVEGLAQHIGEIANRF